MIHIAVARNKHERRIASFPFVSAEAMTLFERMASKGMAACMSWVTETDARVIGVTDSYFQHAA